MAPDEKAIKAVAKNLANVALQLVVPFWVDAKQPKVIGTTSPTKYYDFGGDSRALYTSLVNDTYVKYFSAKYSQKHVEKLFDSALSRLIENQSVDHVEDHIRTIFQDHYNYSREWTVLIPLDNISMSVDVLKIGRIALKNCTGDILQSLTDRLEAMAMSNEESPLEKRKAKFETYKKMFLANVAGFPCAECTFCVESGKAEELAEEATRQAVSLIRYASLFLNKYFGSVNYPYCVGIKGEVRSGGKRSMSLPADAKNVHASNSISSSPFLLDQQMVEKMGELGVFRFSEILQKESPTDFEKAVLRAVRWLSSAQTQPDVDNSFLNLITSLESIFAIQPGDPITNSISEGIALVTQHDLQNRKIIKDKLKKYYRLRSQLTHEGHGEITVEVCNDLTNIIKDFMMVIISRINDFKSRKEFASWIEEQKLGGSVRFPSDSKSAISSGEQIDGQSISSN